MTYDAIKSLSDEDLEFRIALNLHPRKRDNLERQLAPSEQKLFYKVLGRSPRQYLWSVSPRREAEAWLFVRMPGHPQPAF